MHNPFRRLIPRRLPPHLRAAHHAIDVVADLERQGCLALQVECLGPIGASVRIASPPSGLIREVYRERSRIDSEHSPLMAVALVDGVRVLWEVRR